MVVVLMDFLELVQNGVKANLGQVYGTYIDLLLLILLLELLSILISASHVLAPLQQFLS